MTLNERIVALIAKDMEAASLRMKPGSVGTQAEQERQTIGKLLGEGCHLVGNDVVRVKIDGKGWVVEIVTAKVWKEPKEIK